MSTVNEVSSVMRPILLESGCRCAGGIKAFQAKSQPVIRVFAKLLPEFHASHFRTDEGLTERWRTC